MKTLTEIEGRVIHLTAHNNSAEMVRVTAAYEAAALGSFTFDVPREAAREIHIGDRVVLQVQV